MQTNQQKKKIVGLTDLAAQKFHELLKNSESKLLKVGVKNGGCSGMEYTLDYVDTADKYDEHITEKGVEILIEAKAVLFLFGTIIDWEESQFSSKFVFKNPNQTDACGCGESVTIKPIEAIDL